MPKIDTNNKAIICRAIEERLLIQPEVYGRPLQRSLKGYWKQRVGDYRIVYKIEGQTIVVLAIIHRKEVYRKTEHQKVPFRIGLKARDHGQGQGISVD